MADSMRTEKAPSLLKVSKICIQHKDKETVKFCRKHDQLICDSCVSENHQSCEITPVDKAANTLNVSTTMSGLERSMETICPMVESILGEFKARVTELNERKKRIRNQITDIKKKSTTDLSKDETDLNKEAVSNLNKIVADLIKELDEKYKECYEKMVATQNDIKCRYNALNSWRSELKSLLRNVLSSPKDLSTKIQFFKAARFLTSKIHNDEKEIKDLKIGSSKSKLTFCPPDQNFTVDQLLPSLGSISLGESSLVNLFSARELGARVKVFQGCFIPQNKLLLSHEDGNALYVCNYDGSESTRIPVDYSPKGVTVYDKETALIGAWDRGIQTFDLDTLKPGNYIKVGCYVRIITSSNKRICFKRSNKPDELDIIDINGRLRSKTTTNFTAKDASIDVNGCIYCTEYESSGVTCLESGSGHTVYSGPDLKSPSGIAVNGDMNGDIYVADHQLNNVHRISYDGKKHEIILSYDDGITKPVGLSYNRWTGELMVINDDGRSIKIYNTSST